MPVEDNGFLLLRTAEGQVAWLHATWTEWKNTFSFEIFGRDGKLHIEGLGGSYGVERLSYYQMSRRWARLRRPSGSTPARTTPGGTSRGFRCGHGGAATPPVTLRDAHAALTVVHHMYAASRRAT